MTFSGHFACSAFTLTLTPDPAILLPLNVALHFVADAIPHAEYNLHSGISPLRLSIQIVDILVTLLLLIMMLALPISKVIILGTLIAGVLPDLLNGLTKRFWPAFRRFHVGLHTWPVASSEGNINWANTVTGPASIQLKVLLQALVVLCALLALH